MAPILNIPQPPSPEQYPGNALGWQRAAYDWMQRARGVIQNAHNEAVRPAGQQMLGTDFTLNTVATGTTTGTDLANVVATLVDALTQKGILSPTITRESG